MLLSEATKIELGTQNVTKVYLGAAKVWPIGFDPASLAGLRIWFDASQLAGAAGSAVNPWPNLAAGGVSGTIVGTPPPTVSVNTLKTLKLVRFTVSEGRLRATSTGVDKAFTLAYVGRMVPGGYTAGRMICAAYPPPNFLIGFWNGFEDVAYSTSGSFFLPDARKSVTTNWRLYSADADVPPNWYPRMFNNGVLVSTGGSDGSATSADCFSNTFNISGYDPTSTPETGDIEIAEVLLYNRKLPDADRAAVEDYLRSKWL